LWVPEWGSDIQSPFLEQCIKHAVHVSLRESLKGKEKKGRERHRADNTLISPFSDQPVGVGFSYSKAVPAYTNPNYGDSVIALPKTECPDYAEPYGTCGSYSASKVIRTANTTQGAAPNFWKAIQGFMGAFPQYSREDFHFTSESYGGHYGSAFSEYFLEQNAKNIPGAHKINLKSVTINNGW
jgi:hypothetical protein